MAKKPKDDGTRSGRMTGGGPGAGPTIPKVHVSKERAAQGGHVGIVLDGAPVIYDIDFETHSEMPLLYPYQREMLRDIMERQPIVDTPDDAGKTYEGFKDRYAKMASPTGRRVGKHPALGAPYGGKMSDMLRQSSYHFASGSADFMRKADAMRRFYVLGGGEGNRQLAYYAYGMALSQTADNWVDDVYDQKQRRAEAKLREYCMADVMWFGDYAAIERNILINLLIGYTPHAHLLTGPYGQASGQGTGILIEYMSGSDDHPWPTQREADMISGIFVSYGCAPVYARKAADSLFGCGQYSCWVTVSKLALRNLTCAMEVVGCAVTITEVAERYKNDSDFDAR